MAVVTAAVKTTLVHKNPNLSTLPSIDFGTEVFELRTTARRKDISLSICSSGHCMFSCKRIPVQFNLTAAMFFKHIANITTCECENFVVQKCSLDR